MPSLPTEFKHKYQNLLGEAKATQLFAAITKPAKKAFRVNSLKTGLDYDLPQVPNIPHAYYGEVSGQDPEWVSGLVYSQDPAAMFPAFISQVQPGQKVLDLCAAPGGKTTALAEQLNGQGLLVANEISKTRVKALRENLERWGVSNSLITNEDSANLAQVFPQFFDLILVDAPCSGEGMFRKNPDAINYWSQDYVMECQDRQKEILTEAVKMLKKGGKLVYSTCTFSPEEDEEIVDWLSKTYQMKILPAENAVSDQISHGKPEWSQSNNPDLSKTLRFWPQDDLGEGQFAAILQLPGEDIENEQKKKKKRKKKNKNQVSHLNKDEQKLVAKILDDFSLPIALQNWPKTALQSNDHIFIPAIDPQLVSKLKIVNNGVELGLLKKKRFEPGHQLAEVLGKIKQEKVIDLQKENEYLKYLHGEVLQVQSKFEGFILVSFKHLIFSFGKITGNGTLKNFYPKGLRSLK